MFDRVMNEPLLYMHLHQLSQFTWRKISLYVFHNIPWIGTSNHVFINEIWDKLIPSSFFEILEISWVKKVNMVNKWTRLIHSKFNNTKYMIPALREKYPNTRFFLVQIQENTDQKKFPIWTLFTHCRLIISHLINPYIFKTLKKYTAIYSNNHLNNNKTQRR